MTNQVVSQQGLRESFKRANAQLIQAYMDSGQSLQQASDSASQAILTRSYLRLEQPLAANQTLYNFPVLNNQTSGGNPVRATEIRLNQQDAFFVTDISVYLFLATATATNIVPKTYPNAITFSSNSANLYTFYNGFLSITINQSVIIPNFDLLNFLVIPQTQLTGATNTPQDQFNPQFVSLWEPMVSLIGVKNNVVNITLPGAIGGTMDATTFAAIIVRGVKAQNVTLMS